MSAETLYLWLDRLRGVEASGLELLCWRSSAVRTSSDQDLAVCWGLLYHLYLDKLLWKASISSRCVIEKPGHVLKHGRCNMVFISSREQKQYVLLAFVWSCTERLCSQGLIPFFVDLLCWRPAKRRVCTIRFSTKGQDLLLADKTGDIYR